jgi:hypothetical protein
LIALIFCAAAFTENLGTYHGQRRGVFAVIALLSKQRVALRVVISGWPANGGTNRGDIGALAILTHLTRATGRRGGGEGG